MSTLREWKKDRQVYFYRVEYRCWFEPYVFGYLPGIPPYFEAFRGLGFNKVSWFVELDRAGYQFSVLKDAWVAHLDHPRSSRSPKARWKTHKAAARKFYRHLDRTYPKSKNCNVTLN